MQKVKLQLKIQNLGLFVVIFIFSFLLFIGGKANAANLFFEVENQKLIQGDEFLTSIFLNTENEEINAVKSKIIFPADILELKEIKDGNSIINFWIERPRTEQAGIIGFSGIIPGGYQEIKGFLFSVVFRAKSSGSGVIEIGDAKVLLNDGKGTSASLKISPFQFFISQEGLVVQSTVESVRDTDLPENFKPEIAQNPDMFDGQWFLVFATQDKGSGIDYYEVCERSKTKCVIAESPYVLKDQNLRSYIYVKAADKAGNERIVVVKPRYPIMWYEIWWIWGIIILVIIIAYLLKKILWRRYTKIH